MQDVWEYFTDNTNKLITLLHNRTDLKYTFTEYSISKLTEDTLQDNFNNKLTDWDIIKANKILYRHKWS